MRFLLFGALALSLETDGGEKEPGAGTYSTSAVPCARCTVADNGLQRDHASRQVTYAPCMYILFLGLLLVCFENVRQLLGYLVAFMPKVISRNLTIDVNFKLVAVRQASLIQNIA